MERFDAPMPKGRPELSQHEPSEVFLYAARKQAWLRQRVAHRQLPDALDHLAGELDGFLNESFQAAPRIDVQSGSVYGPQLERVQGDAFMLSSVPLEKRGDAQITGVHTLRGLLYGFHGALVNNTPELCVYIAPQTPPVKVRAGIYQPLYSAVLRESSIQFVDEQERDIRRRLGGFVSALDGVERERVNRSVRQLLEALEATDMTLVDKLRMSGRQLEAILGRATLPLQFSDTLLDAITARLDLSSSMAVHALSHRRVTSTDTVRSFTVAGEGEFYDVAPQLALIGETARRALALQFYTQTTPVQVPVQQLVSLRHMPR